MKMGVPCKKLSGEAMEYLVRYPWKGNIRELENFVKRIIAAAGGECIRYCDLAMHFTEAPCATPLESSTAALPARNEPVAQSPAGAQAPPSSSLSFDGYTWEGLERAYVLYLLEKNKWHITRAAKQAGVNRSTFDSRMKKLGITKAG
jgi:DNA-binding NtrC family response regulator